MLPAQGDHPAHEMQHGGGVAFLGFNIDGLIAVNGVHDHRQIEAGDIGGGETGVSIHIPLHGSADSVTVAEEDIVPHAQFVAVIDHRRSGHGKKQRVQQFHAAAAVVEQGRQAPANTGVESHPAVLGIFPVHVIPLRIGHHFQGQFVVIAQKKSPLAVLGYGWSTFQNVGNRMAVFQADRHEHPRHQWKMIGHVAFVAIAEIMADIFGPLIGFGQEHAPRIMLVEVFAELFEYRMGFRQIFIAGALPDAEIGHRIKTHPVYPHIKPEAHHLQDGLDHLRVVMVQVGLMGEEAMPVVGLCLRVPGPVRIFGIAENDPGFRKFFVGVAPDIIFSAGRVGLGSSGRLEPVVLVRGMVDDQFRDDPDFTAMSFTDEGSEIPQRAVTRMDGPVVGNVIAVIPEWRRIKRQKPEGVHPELLNIIKFFNQPAKISDAVAIAVLECLDMHFINNCVLVPEGVCYNCRH